MTNIAQTNLPVAFRNGLLALEPFLAAHPGLEAGIETIEVKDGHTIASWAKNGYTHSQLQAVAMAHPELKWKRERRMSDFAWFSTHGDVTIMLPHAEPLELSFEPSTIDFDKLKPISPPTSGGA